MPAVLSRVIVKDTPYIVSEINESFPNDYACEMLPLVTAYALLQDWDGIFWHSYTGGHFNWDEIWQTNHFAPPALERDPMKMSQMAITGMMFHRGDVQAAHNWSNGACPGNGRWKACASLRTATILLAALPAQPHFADPPHRHRRFPCRRDRSPAGRI